MKICTKCGIEKQEIDFYKDKRRKDGLYSYCKKCNSKELSKWRKKNPDKYREQLYKWRRKKQGIFKNFSDYTKQINDEHRIQSLFYYSNGDMKCTLCGNDNIDVLDLDHINGNGNEHRRKNKSRQLSQWCYYNNFPEGFRVLCRNCNWIEYLKRKDGNLI